MKKFFLGAALMLASVAASAQVYVGGSVGFNRNTTENITDFTIAPEVGYNLNEKWAVGATLNYNYKYVNEDHEDDSAFKKNMFSIAPYARYTYASFDRVNLFVDGGFGLGFGKAKIGDESSDTACTYEIGFKPGVAFAVNEKFSLVAHFGFLGYQGANDAGKAVQPEKIGFDFSSMNLSLGFYVNF